MVQINVSLLWPIVPVFLTQPFKPFFEFNALETCFLSNIMFSFRTDQQREELLRQGSCRRLLASHQNPQGLQREVDASRRPTR